MAAPDPQLSPVALATALFTLILGPQLAPYAGAYSVIVFGWTAGVFVGALRLPEGGRFRLPVFVIVSLIVTLGMSVPMAELLATNASRVLPDWIIGASSGLLFPVSFAIPAVGHSWPAVATWAWGLIGRLRGGTAQ